MLYWGALYHHWVAALNGCHQDAGHQGQQQTLSSGGPMWPPRCSGNLEVWAMHPTWRHLCQSSSVTDHCYHTLGVVACWFYQHWDNNGVGSTPKSGEPFGLLWPFCEAHHGIHDPQSNCENFHLVPVARLCLDLQSTGQAPEWQGGPILKATSSESFGSLWAYRWLRLCLTMLKPMDMWNELTKHLCAW